MYGKIKSRMTALILAFLSVTMLCGGAKTVFASETGAAQSSNAHLKSLKVEPGTLSPEFSEDVTAYTLTVDEDVESVKVTCSLAESSAKVIEAGGFKSLAAGSNDALIKVQAEDGTVCVYNITIIRGSAAAGEGTQGEGNAAPEEAGEPGNASAPEETGEPADGQESGGAQGEAVPISASGDKIPVGGDDIFASFLVNKSFSAPLPEGFTQEEYQYKGVPVQSARYAAGDLRLLYLTAGDGTSGDFRIYYEDDDVFLDFLQIKGLEGRFIMPVRFQAQMKVPDNYTDSFLPWGDKVIDCYIYTELTGAKMSYEEDENGDVKLVAGDSADASKPVHIEELKEEPEFYLLYAMNETGAEGFYLYDSVEGTYQRYVERDTSYDLDQSYFKYKTIAHQRFAFMCVMTAFLVIAVIVIINLVMRNKELLADLEDEDEDRQTAKKKKRDAPKPGKTKPRRETAE